MSVPILSIVGYSNAGKTTLMEKLVEKLTAQGLSIATIKHSHHQPELDTPGKDSWRHKNAGAEASFLVGPEQMMMVADIQHELNPRLLAEQYCIDFDLVLVEGYASLPGEKIEVLRAARSDSLRCDPTELLAVVTDLVDLQVEVKQIGLDDIESVAGFVLNWMHKRDSQ
ncbi:molybdopterin-guanine dinucleotide biosynthesis protein B [Mariprofundus micogutta]|uniref:Molybdopterin-guanine dinucleotide biosynthesis protein B n=1 Tax=Mariprofundus micogutta TaxID=1921010 RepID=A0A1L8CQD8_9PROT|nr:molybdopterin-guanine dinucleotide biosynthesis protein B [Mariprofundus micogutta]GAV21140.1 molybdopterin-guanine dinucleotide biosynthesis protein B [Mariprofundus micogutta]